jgi:putative ABC transport system permease protein
MIHNYVLFALRTFQRNKVSFMINFIGMTIALGCCIAAYVNFEYNNGFDKTQTNRDKLYRIGFTNLSDRKTIPYGVCPMPVSKLIAENLNSGDQVVRYISKQGQFRINDDLFEKEFIYADPAFTQLFSMKVLKGSLSLKNKEHVLISDKLALTYFGDINVVGKSMTQIIAGVPRDLIISGVYQSFPSNSSFRFQLITTFDNYFTDPSLQSETENDWKRWTTAFLYLENKNSIATIEKQLTNYVKPQNEARPDLPVSKYYIEPFAGIGTRAVKEKNQGHWLNQPMPPAAVLAPFMMALFILLVACFNVTNNAIAIATKRLKEIGIRKVVGGRRKELIIQFLAENLVFCFISLALSLIVAEYFVAGWDFMWPGLEFSIQYANNLPFFLMLCGLLLVTSLLSGAYPAFYISSFKPIQILKGTTKFGGTNWFTKSLLVFQFSISLAAVIFALAFYFNSKFQKEYDLGYSYDSVIQIPVENQSQFVQLKASLMANPLITSIGGSQHHIYNSSLSVSAQIGNQEKKEVDMLRIGEGYFETLHVRVLAGRAFARDSETDIKESIIVNQQFLKEFNILTEPIGKRVMLNDSTPCYIVGVVKDVFLRALFEPISPVVFRYAPESDYKFLVAKTQAAHLRSVNQQIEADWKLLFPFSLYPGKLMEERMVMALDHFDNVIILYSFMGLVAIIMSVSGLYSLVSINLKKRTKELGIRKILGASLPHIVIQSTKLFMVMMMIAFIIGTAMGSLMVNKLMDTVWEYYIAANASTVAMAIGILVAITVVTIGYKVRSVSLSNPVDALRHE